MKIAIYLRKSRADEELEKTLGQGETLSKHRRALLKFAKEKKLNIVEIKEEIVSGESLFFRPEMLELLKEIEEKQYDGVLTMDIQRLGRGDMQDQGIILKTFKDAQCKIITPQKTYDLDNDFDEEYSEFEAFMARKELKMINRRMQGGRVRSIEDGNYISPNPPFGYDITYINKSRTLQPNEVESAVVKLIFKMYIEGSGAGTIANYLSSLGYKTKFGNEFGASSILFTLKNLVYIGKVTWKKKDIKKSKDPNKVTDSKTRAVEEWIIADGKHPAIIKDETFNKAQEILKGKYHVPYKFANGVANPLAGLIVCDLCGGKMFMRKYGDKDAHINCKNKCGNRSAKFKYIEHEIILSLEQYLKDLNVESENIASTDDVDIYTKQNEILNRELGTLSSQKLKLFDLLEQEVYTNEVFIERMNNITKRTDSIEQEIGNIKIIIKKQNKKTNNNSTTKIKNAIESYKNTNDIALKNELLKSVLYKVEYKKTKDQRNDNFTIKLFPRL